MLHVVVVVQHALMIPFVILAFPDIYIIIQQKHVQVVPHFVQHAQVQHIVHNVMLDFT